MAERGARPVAATDLYARSEPEVGFRTTRGGLNHSLRLRDPTHGQFTAGQHAHAP